MNGWAILSSQTHGTSKPSLINNFRRQKDSSSNLLDKIPDVN